MEYLSSNLNAANGSLNINAKENTNVTGSSVFGKDVNIITNNLNLTSLQSSSQFSNKSTSNNLGGNIGFNNSNNTEDQLQTTNLASIIGTNSVNINVGVKDQNGNYLNNSGNLNLTAALIANATINPNGTLNDQNNLILNTHSLTYLDLENHNSSESNQISVSLQLGKNPNKPVTPGNLEINLSNHGNQSSSNSKATIGQGVININNKTSSEILLDSNSTALDIASAHAVNSINRDINQTTQNQQNILTSDFDAKLKIDTRLIVAGADLLIGDKEGAKENWDDYVNQTKRGYDILTSETAKDIYGKVWASPNTAIGLTLGGAGYLYGLATGQNVNVSLGNNAVQFEGSQLGIGDSAITLGNVINYFNEARPNKIFPTYEANNSFWTGGITYDSIILGNHEQQHTYQAQILGPFYLPTYLFSGIFGAAANGVFTINPVIKYNYMEQSADKAGNQALKQQRNEN